MYVYTTYLRVLYFFNIEMFCVCQFVGNPAPIYTAHACISEKGNLFPVYIAIKVGYTK